MFHYMSDVNVHWVVGGGGGATLQECILLMPGVLSNEGFILPLIQMLYKSSGFLNYDTYLPLPQ